jgi:hypothetical protein
VVALTDLLCGMGRHSDECWLEEIALPASLCKHPPLQAKEVCVKQSVSLQTCAWALLLFPHCAYMHMRVNTHNYMCMHTCISLLQIRWPTHKHEYNMYTYIGIYVHARPCICIYAYKHMRIHVSLYIHINIYMYICMFTHPLRARHLMCVCIYIYIYICIYICIKVYIYIYI